ncbi:transporter [Bradyrhizobium ganzhouense]|uniref:transporter n=1 Tax=Bradyrhizobium ganzhouense TaxID=1179767 RepID=UPI003CECBDDB
MTVAKGDPAVRFEHAAGPYFVFRGANVEVVLASPSGGSPLMEPAGDSGASTDLMQRFRRDGIAIDEFSDTVSLDRVYADDFDAAFCVGLPGAVWRPELHTTAGALIAKLLAAGKPVAVMPSGIDLAPVGTGAGLLIIGDETKSSIAIARALLGAIGQSHINTRGTCHD